MACVPIIKSISPFFSRSFIIFLSFALVLPTRSSQVMPIFSNNFLNVADIPESVKTIVLSNNNNSIDKEFYKKDYQDITEKILFDNVDYSVAIDGVRKVVEFGLF